MLSLLWCVARSRVYNLLIDSVFYDVSRKTLIASFTKNGKVDQRASLNTSDMSTREVVAEALKMLKKHIKDTPNL